MLDLHQKLPNNGGKKNHQTKTEPLTNKKLICPAGQRGATKENWNISSSECKVILFI